MNFTELIRHRYSVRAYKDREVEEDKLMQVMEAGRLAPSAVNNQPWHFVVVRAAHSRKQFAQVYEREWFGHAPIFIVICGDHQESWNRQADGKDHCDIDAAIAIDHMTLQATDLGLGTCWVCNFNAELCSKLLNLPSHIEPVAILPMGYPASDHIPAKKRKDLKDIVHWEEF